VSAARRGRYLIALAPFACVSATGCGDSTAPARPRPRPNIIVTISPTLAGAFATLGVTQTFRATVTDTLGDTLTDVVTWSASNAPGSTAIAVASDGTATVAPSAVPGDYAVVAAAGGVADTATMRVLAAPAGKLVFSARVGSDAQLFVKDFAVAGDAAQITTGSGTIAGLAVDQTTGVIFFSKGALPNVDIYRVAMDGTSLANLTNDVAQSNQGPSVNPVTHDVYFSRRGTSGSATQIFRMTPNGGAPVQVTTGTQSKIQPAVSPDGNSLAWGELLPGSSQEIMTAAIDGSNPVQLTSRTGINGGALWFSNTRILWSFLAPGVGGDVYSLDVGNPSAVANLTNGAGTSTQPSGGCAANTAAIVRTGASGTLAYQLDLGTSLAVPYTLPVSRTVAFARRLC